MADIFLPCPEGPRRLRLTLQLVKDIEETGGSIFKIADQLLQKELGLSDIIPLLATAYRSAGAEMTEDALGAFLMAQADRQPALLLTDILVGILAPAHKLGAVAGDTDAGKRKPDPAGASTSG